jgi:uncharacterized protein (TIGR00661 family)
MNCLSRLKAYATSQTNEQQPAQLFLGIVSGPEPQRSIFQEILWEEGNQLHLPFKLIAGTADKTHNHAVSSIGAIIPHLGGPDLVKAIENTKYVISRGGYTSLMELIPLNKPLILVPTPGQTEQIYLAKRWQEKGWAIAYDQTEFRLETALKEADNFNYQPIPFIPFSKEALEAILKKVNL